MPEEENQISVSVTEAKILFNILMVALRQGLPMALQEMTTVHAVASSLLNRIEAVEPKPEVESPKFEVVED